MEECHAVAFFDELGRDNTKAWWQANAERWRGSVREPMERLLDSLEDEFGREQVTAALSDVVRDHAFEMLDADRLRDSLARSLQGGERFDRLWTRWMERRHGDADLRVDADAGLGGLLGQGTLDELLGGGGQDAEQLTDLLGELLGGLETGGKG